MELTLNTQPEMPLKTLKQRFNHWRRMQQVTLQHEAPEVVAGRHAESQFHDLIATTLKYKGVQCFVDKRVRSNKLNRRFEIDLIVLTKKQLHVIEIKNWSGQLVSRGDEWIQIKRNGTESANPNLTTYNGQKAQVLREYLGGKGVSLPNGFISQKVVFMNANLALSKDIADNPDVIQRWQIDKYLKGQRGAGAAENIVHSLIEACLNSERSKEVLIKHFGSLSSAAYDNAAKYLEELRTWDLVKLHGGRILQGDALEMWAGADTITMNIFKPDTKIKVGWVRGFLLSAIRIIGLGMSPGWLKTDYGISMPLYPERSNLLFHVVGQKQPASIPLQSIDWIRRG